MAVRPLQRLSTASAPAGLVELHRVVVLCMLGAEAKDSGGNGVHATS